MVLATAYAQIGHPAAEPAVGAAHQAPAPLVGAAGDRELGRELGVHGDQQALAGQRHRQDPDPRRPGHRHAHEHHGVEADDRRDRGESHRDVAEDVQAAVELLRGSPARPGARRRRRLARRRRSRRSGPSRSRRSRSIARATSTREDDAELHEDVPQVRLDRLVAEEQLGGDLAVGLAVGHEVGDLELALGQRRARRSPPPSAGPRFSARAPSLRSSRRTASRSRTEPQRVELPLGLAQRLDRLLALARRRQRPALEAARVGRREPRADRSAARAADSAAAARRAARVAARRAARAARARAATAVGQLQTEPRGVLLGAAHVGARRPPAARARARRARGSPSRSSARPGSRTRARPRRSARIISNAAVEVAELEERRRERPPRAAARRRHRAARQAAADARALLAGLDRPRRGRPRSSGPSRARRAPRRGSAGSPRGARTPRPPRRARAPRRGAPASRAGTASRASAAPAAGPRPWRARSRCRGPRARSPSS